MTSTEAYNKGLYVLTVWATAADVSAATVRTNFVNRYGKAEVESLGVKQQGLNYAKMADVFQDLQDDGASLENPTMADINTALLTLGGTPPSTIEILGDVGADLWGKINFGAGLFLFGAAAWFLFASGVLPVILKELKKRG